MIQVCNSKIRTAGAMTTPLGFPDLNFDILFYIISRLARRDVACLSCTCHALRRALSPELPRGGVTLEARHLTSFVLFADVKHGEDRLRYLHTLVLPGSTYQSISSSKQDIEGALSTVLLAAPNLGSLSILDLKVLSFRPETLKKVFQSLSRLRELEITVIQKKYEEAGQKCLDSENGKYLQYVGTAAAVRDMVSIANVLDGPDTPINYIGISYGTLIGSWFVNSEG